jgi:hypothetical protein
MYPTGKAHILGLATKVDLVADNIKMAMLDAAEILDPTDEFLSSITGGNIVATSPNLTGKTVTAGVFDCADYAQSSVTSGKTICAVIFYKDSGSAATSPLLLWEDVFPFPTDGSNINVYFNSAGIFAI